MNKGILKNLKIAIEGSDARVLPIIKFFQKKSINIVRVFTKTSLKNKIVFDPISIKYENFDIYILAGSPRILKNSEISKVNFGVLNCHAGKLPEYRGSSPLNWALINDEKIFGLSVIKIDSKIDTGRILASREFDILNEWTINNLHKIARENFPEMVFESILKLFFGIKGYAQPKSTAKYFPLRSPNDGEIDWYDDDALRIQNKIRALEYPYPGCFALLDNKQIFFEKFIDKDLTFHGVPGKVYGVKKNLIKVATKLGLISVLYSSSDSIEIKKYIKFDKS